MGFHESTLGQLRGSRRLCVLCFVLTGLLFSGSAFCNETWVTDLAEYVGMALVGSDSAADLRDVLADRALDLELAAHGFTVQWVPLARFGTGVGTFTQSGGIEGRLQTTLGPMVTVGMSADQVTSDEFAVTNSHRVTGYVRITQGLFRRWGSTYNRAPLSRAELANERESALAQRRRQEIVLASVQRYYSAVLSSRLVEQSAQALERSRRYVELAHARQSVGLVSKVDVYRAELAALAAENALQEQQRGYRRDVEQLYEHVSAVPDGSIRLRPDIDLIVPVMVEDWEQAILDLRADWHAQRLDQDIAEIEMYQARRGVLPDLNVSVEMTQRGTGSSFDDAFGSQENDWSVRLELNSTFDRTRERANVSRALRNRERLSRHQDALERQIRREAREAMEDMLAEARRREIAESRLEQAASVLDLAQLRYERGLSDNLAIIDAELAFAEAELDTSRAIVNYNLAAVRWAHSVGILDVNWLHAALSPDALSPDEQRRYSP